MHRRKPSGDVDPRPWCQGLPTLRVYGSSEVLALRVSDIDSEPLLLRIEQGKGRRKDRFAMLSPLLLELLRDCRIVQPSDTQRRLCRR
jgi:integrase